MKGIYLLLGSNLGNSLEMLEIARKQIAYHIGEIVIQSSIYQTKAWGIENQPEFLNQVLEVDSSLSPIDLLAILLRIEVDMGRKRYQKWGSRIIDIDILYYGDQVIEAEKLKIPHPENQNRNFVLAPMVEIAADFIHPVLGHTHAKLLEKCGDTLAVKRII